MWDRYRRDLRRALRNSAGREIGLLVANYEAEREFRGTSSLAKSTLQDSAYNIRAPGDVRQFNAIFEAQERLSVYLSNLQTRYLLLRETIMYLRGIFFLFKQYQYVEELLNDISWGRGKRAGALQQRIVSSSHFLLLADIALDEEGKYIRVRVFDTCKEIAFKAIEAIRDQTLLIKTKIEVARGFMEERAIHLTAYEGFLDRIEEDLREHIRSTQHLLYAIDDSELWREMREFLAQHDDDFLKLIEALPDYGGLEIDEDAFRIEEDILLNDGE